MIWFALGAVSLASAILGWFVQEHDKRLQLIDAQLAEWRRRWAALEGRD